MADQTTARLTRRQVARFAEEYLSTLVLEAMVREGLIDPVKTPERVEIARDVLAKAAKLVGGMQKGPLTRYVIQADGELLNDLVKDGVPTVAEVAFESAAELAAFNSGIEDFDGWENLEVHDKRAAAEARVADLLAPYREDEFTGKTEEWIIVRMGWSVETVNGLRKRYIDEDRHKEGSFEDWIRKLAAEEEAECAADDSDEE